MKSQITDRFQKCFSALPNKIKKKAKQAYKLFSINPYHPSLFFKKIHRHSQIFSIRITLKYRAIGVMKNDVIIWFWIGSHNDYDKLLKQFE